MQLSETQIIFLKPEYESWEKFAREYIENFILNHDIYRHIPSDVPWDLSGSVSLVKNNLVNYISKQEVDFYNDCFLDLLYTGEEEASYCSGYGFNHITYREAIREHLYNVLYDKLLQINSIDADEEYNTKYEMETEDVCEELSWFIVEMEEEWIDDIIIQYDKEIVIEIIKQKSDDTKETVIEFTLPDKETWKNSIKNYIDNYIANHVKKNKIYKIDYSEKSYDNSKKLKSIQKNIFDYISLLEINEFDKNVLCLLYNGHYYENFSYGYKVYFETYYDDIIEHLHDKLDLTLRELNATNDRETNEELKYLVYDLEKEWIYEIVNQYDKADVMETIKNKCKDIYLSSKIVSFIQSKEEQ